MAQTAGETAGWIHGHPFRRVCPAPGALWVLLDRTRGSHHVFVHPDIAELLSIQPRKDGKAKPYQLRQFLKLVEEYSLKPEDE